MAFSKIAVSLMSMLKIIVLYQVLFTNKIGSIEDIKLIKKSIEPKKNYYNAIATKII